MYVGLLNKQSLTLSLWTFYMNIEVHVRVHKRNTCIAEFDLGDFVARNAIHASLC